MDSWTPSIVTMLISAVISSVIAWKIGLYIRFNTKPVHEIVYQDNRTSNLKLIFNGIRLSDSTLGSIFEIFTDKFGELSRNRKVIIADPISSINTDFGKFLVQKKIFDETVQGLQDTLKRMREQRKDFLKDYHVLQNYFHDSFLRDINQYLWLAEEYVSELFKNENHGFKLIKRKDIALKIIEYIESDKSINKNERNIQEFITMWKETLDEIKF